MHCPNCNYAVYYTTQPCTNCQFSGDPNLIEELMHIRWVVPEIDTWLALSSENRQFLHQQYITRQYELEVELGLRLRRLTEAEAVDVWPDLFQREALLQKSTDWLAAGLLDPAPTQSMLDQTKKQIKNLLEQLEGQARPVYPQTEAESLELINFLLEGVNHLAENGGFTSPESSDHVLAALLEEKERLESKPGSHPAAELAGQETERVESDEPQGQSQPAAVKSDEPPFVTAAVPSPPPPPPTPLLDRVWRTLLSERTLQALLFLGIFLLFSAALSFVIWGWEDFSAPLRVAIPGGFTAVFFILGWYVRTRTQLHRSGIALSAIAALLIPIDLYTVYINFHIPADYQSLFWLITSLICLLAYTIATLIIRSRFFGYLVGVAAGSTVLAVIQLGHNAFDLSLDWRTAGLSILALGLTLTATSFSHRPPAIILTGEIENRPRNRWQVFAEPFRYLALLSVGVLMLLVFGWRYIERTDYDTLHYALTVDWWIGGLIFGWGAIYYRSRSLGLLAAMSLPVATYLAQAVVFYRFGIHPAWHAVGWALLVPLYFLAGYRLLKRSDDPILYTHGRAATRWGVVLLIIAALWSLTNLSNAAAAASSHVVLAGAIVLAVVLWQRPIYLYGTSLLLLSSATFTMSELKLSLSQLSVGWASLAIVHIIVALRVGAWFPGSASPARYSSIPAPLFTRPLVMAGYSIAALCLVPPLYPYDGSMLAYALGNWIGLTAWGARLAHLEQPGFILDSAWRKSIFHWFTALSLPIWLLILFTNRGPLDFKLPLALSILAWGMVSLSYRFDASVRTRAYRRPWYLSGLVLSVVAPVIAFMAAPDGFTPAISLLLAGLLYTVDAVASRHSWELAPAGLVTASGYLLFLDRLHFSFDLVSFALACFIAAYVLTGLLAERQNYGWRRRVRKTTEKEAASTRAILWTQITHRFLSPLYLAIHLLTLILLWRIYVRPVDMVLFNIPWTDGMRLWGAASQLILALVYSVYAWAACKERWGHLATWLIAAAGGFVAISYSHGRGSSAVLAALMAVLFVLAERGLCWARSYRWPGVSRRKQAFIRLTWRLYKRPLLVTGWTTSVGAIALALGRNLWWLGGGRPQRIWAIAGLLLVTSLYVVSAWLFRKARFMWLAALLVLAPWTLLTSLGWFTPWQPTVPGYALSWIVLAWLLFLASLVLDRSGAGKFALPLKAAAHILLPFSLLWGLANVDTSRFTFGLGIAFYTLAAVLTHDRLRKAGGEISVQKPLLYFRQTVLWKTRFLYPALSLVPAWSIFLLAWLLPSARHEHYGLLLLVFGPLGLAGGRLLRSIAPQPELRPAYALPGYLTGYISLIVGTMLVAHEPALLSITLVFDGLLLVASACLFRNALWLYPAAVITPVALLLALNQAGTPGNRHGWWLIGLATIYLLLAWLLRRVHLTVYSTATLTTGFALVALGLPPSSQDQIGALWGYGAAALLYVWTAKWLRQPLLLAIASALAVVPYAVGLQRSGLVPEYYGLALFSGAIVVVVIGWQLDRHLGCWRDYPWQYPYRWPAALADRWLNWWALPLYVLGFGLAIASPIFTSYRAGLSALNLFLLMLLCGWAVYYFRRRGWLLVMVAAGHLAVVFYLAELGWWRYPAWAWLRFLPVTLITGLVALFIERYRKEGTPLTPGNLYHGWSRPLYIMLVIDIIVGQVISFSSSSMGTLVTVIHMLLIALLASVWLSESLAYLSAIFGVIAVSQWWSTWEQTILTFPILWARLDLGYGLVGYGVKWIGSNLPKDRELRLWLAIWGKPLQRFGLGFSLGILVLTAWLGLDIVGWTFRAILGLPFRQIVNVTTVQMVVGVLALLGLLYLAATFSQHWTRGEYIAIGMLLVAWILHAFYIQQWDKTAWVQWYAVPAGLYLLGIAYAEWRRGNRLLARWLDYGAMLLMLGSLFWQTLLFGWGYALLLGLEGFVAFWWGSARRLRRFFYAGMVAIILATLGQLINSLRSINQWIVFGGIGLLLVIVAIVIERKLEDIKAWHEVILESWE